MAQEYPVGEVVVTPALPHYQSGKPPRMPTKDAQ